MSASIATTSTYQFPNLADISQTGAMLRGSRLPPTGSTALLKAGPLQVLCTVVWVKGEQCGVRFDEAVTPAILNQVHREGAVVLKVSE